MRHRSLTFRVTVTAVLLAAAVCVAISVLSASVVARYLTDELDDALTDTHQRAIRTLVRGLPPTPPPGTTPPDIPDTRGQEVGTLTAYFVGDMGNGQVIEGDGQLTILEATVLDALFTQAAAGQVGEPHTAQLPTIGEYRLLRTEFDSITIVTGLPTEPVAATVASLRRWLTLFGALGTVVVGSIALLVVRHQLSPLRQVASTANQVIATDLSRGEIEVMARVSPQLAGSSNEVAQVAAALNALLEHVEGALATRQASEQHVRQFVADASHELRTPLATVIGYAELGLRADADRAVQQQALVKVHTEAGRMSALVNDLLVLARLDQGRPLAREEVDLTHLVMESVADARITAPQHHWRMTLPETPVIIRGDEARLHQVLTNLLGNAARHTPSGTTVQTSLVANNEHVQLTVTDDGPGIPQEFHADLFNRFTRGESARTHAVPGAGLGLSLARSIARAHGGEITVRSTPESTVFAVHLPRDRTSRL